MRTNQKIPFAAVQVPVVHLHLVPVFQSVPASWRSPSKG